VISIFAISVDMFLSSQSNTQCRIVSMLNARQTSYKPGGKMVYFSPGNPTAWPRSGSSKKNSVRRTEQSFGIWDRAPIWGKTKSRSHAVPCDCFVTMFFTVSAPKPIRNTPTRPVNTSSSMSFARAPAIRPSRATPKATKN